MELLLRLRPAVKVWSILWLWAAVWTAGCGRKAGPDPARLRAQQAAKKYVEQGEDCLLKGDKKKAVAAYSKAIQVDPGCQTAYVRSGMIYKDAGSHKKALADFSKAIDLDPQDSYPYELRRDLYRNVYHNEAQAEADDQAAALIRQGRWEQLKELRKKR